MRPSILIPHGPIYLLKLSPFKPSYIETQHALTQYTHAWHNVVTYSLSKFSHRLGTGPSCLVTALTVADVVNLLQSRSTQTSVGGLPLKKLHHVPPWTRFSAYHRISSGFSHWEMNPSVGKNRFETFVKHKSDNNLNFQQSRDHVGQFLALKWVKMIIKTGFVKTLSMENSSSELQEDFTSNLQVKRWLPLIKVLNYLQTQQEGPEGPGSLTWGKGHRQQCSQ